jgi:hypothetical protein
MQRVLKFIGGYLALSLSAGIGWLILDFPSHPKSASGCFWLFMLVLPLIIVGEYVGEFLWNNKVTRVVELKTTGRSFSWLRIAYASILFPHNIRRYVRSFFLVQGTLTAP